MGRKTYESIGRPLPERTTIVVTRQEDWKGAEGVLIAATVPEAISLAQTMDEEVFVVGGAQVYAEALPVADRLALTLGRRRARGRRQLSRGRVGRLARGRTRGARGLGRCLRTNAG